MRLHNINTSNTVSATQPYVDTAVATKLSLAGGTMTGPIVLPANPTTPLQAATKQYSDSGDTALQTQVTSLQGTVTTLNANPVTLTYVNTHDALKVNKAGDTMTGQLVLPGAPTLVTHAVTKGYVDTLVTTHTANVALHLTPAQNTLLDAVTVTSTEINTLSGTTSNIQTQINTLSTTLVPTGTVIEVDTTTTPSKYLRANGTQVSKTTYAALFAVIGERYAPLMSGMKGQPWRQQYSFNKANSTIGAWVANTPLPVTIYISQTIVTNNRVYLLGGWNGVYLRKVFTAPINPDGTLGAWVAGALLPINLFYSQAIVINNKVYLLGGLNNGIASAIVYTATINPDGTLGAWVTGVPLPVTIYTAQTIVTNNRVYLLGGVNNGAYSSKVYTAPINANGTLGTWVNSTPLPGAVAYSQAIVTNNRIYLLGGYVNGVASSIVYTAPINPDGTLGAWVTGAPLPVTIYAAQIIVTNNRVYLLGGINNGAYSSKVYTAPINANGTLGAWVNSTPLPVTVGYSQAIVTNSRVYLLGGYNGNIALNTVYSTPFSGGLNNYTSLTSINATTFTLPDYTIMDTASSPKTYHYIKF